MDSLNNISAPVFSVIVPAYNAEPTLARCLDSIIKQAMPDYEVIIVNDGSTDRTQDIAEAYSAKDSRFRVIHQFNQGASSARNTGLSLAKGEWIVFLDADDCFSGEYIPLSINPDIDLYFQNGKFVGESREYENLKIQTITSEQFGPFLQSIAHLDIFRGILCKIIKRSIIEQHHILFNTNVRLAEDTLFFMQYACFCQQVQVLGTGYYEYHRSASEWDVKYSISKVETLYYFDVFMDQYDLMPVKLPQLAQFIFSFFLSKMDNAVISSWRWKLAPPVIRIKRAVPCSFSAKVKLYLESILSGILHSFRLV